MLPRRNDRAPSFRSRRRPRADTSRSRAVKSKRPCGACESVMEICFWAIKRAFPRREAEPTNARYPFDLARSRQLSMRREASRKRVDDQLLAGDEDDDDREAGREDHRGIGHDL